MAHAEADALVAERIKSTTRDEYESKAKILIVGLRAVKPDAIGKPGNRLRRFHQTRLRRRLRGDAP